MSVSVSNKMAMQSTLLQHVSKYVLSRLQPSDSKLLYSPAWSLVQTGVLGSCPLQKKVRRGSAVFWKDSKQREHKIHKCLEILHNITFIIIYQHIILYTYTIIYSIMYIYIIILIQFYTHKLSLEQSFSLLMQAKTPKVRRSPHPWPKLPCQHAPMQGWHPKIPIDPPGLME